MDSQQTRPPPGSDFVSRVMRALLEVSTGLVGRAGRAGLSFPAE